MSDYRFSFGSWNIHVGERGLIWVFWGMSYLPCVAEMTEMRPDPVPVSCSF